MGKSAWFTIKMIMAKISSRLNILCAQVPSDPPPSAREVEHLIGEDGHERLAGYVHLQDSWRFVLGRALLFHGLKTLFGVNVAKVALTPFGRPVLQNAQKLKIDFNISHAGKWVVCAFARFSQVGVDVVDVNDFDDWQELSNTILAPIEQLRVSTVESAKQQELVSRYWAVKEAVLKCAGVGLQVDPLDINVDLCTKNSPQVTKCPLSIANSPKDFRVMVINLRRNATLSVVSKNLDAAEANFTSCVSPRIHIIPVDTVLSSFRSAAS